MTPGDWGFSLSKDEPDGNGFEGFAWPRLRLVRVAAPLSLECKFGASRFSGVLESGNVAVCPPGLPIDCTWRSRPGFHILSFPDAVVERSLAAAQGGRAARLSPVLRCDDVVSRGLFSTLVHEGDRGWPAGRCYAEWLAQALLTRVVTLHAESRGHGTSAVGLTPRQVTRVVAVIDAELERKLTLARLAEVAGLSRFHFARCFRASLGVSPMQYLADRRMERGAELLRRGRLSIIEIALACGYDNPSHFAKVFRRKFGESPSQFAKTA